MTLFEFVKSSNGLTSYLRELPSKRTDGAEINMTEHIKLKFFMDPDNPALKNVQNFVIFIFKDDEEWIALEWCCFNTYLVN